MWVSVWFWTSTWFSCWFNWTNCRMTLKYKYLTKKNLMIMILLWMVLQFFGFAFFCIQCDKYIIISFEFIMWIKMLFYHLLYNNHGNNDNDEMIVSIIWCFFQQYLNNFFFSNFFCVSEMICLHKFNNSQRREGEGGSRVTFGPKRQLSAEDFDKP